MDGWMLDVWGVGAKRYLLNVLQLVLQKWPLLKGWPLMGGGSLYLRIHMYHTVFLLTHHKFEIGSLPRSASLRDTCSESCVISLTPLS
jgi:hypothetical protein